MLILNQDSFCTNFDFLCISTCGTSFYFHLLWFDFEFRYGSGSDLSSNADATSLSFLKVELSLYVEVFQVVDISCIFVSDAASPDGLGSSTSRFFDFDFLGEDGVSDSVDRVS